MSKTVFLFPGQGSQGIGMGVALAERFHEAKDLFNRAHTVLGFDLLEACTIGPDDRLRATDVAQPALYVTGVLAAALLKARGITPAAVAGHSVGEYAALAAAEVFSFEEGLNLVRERGQMMKLAGEQAPGTMAAVLGLTADTLRELCAKVTTHGVCEAVNFNSPEQIVVAGERSAIEALLPLAQAAGAKKVIPLNVAGAFHSSLMKDAATQMAERIRVATLKEPKVPVVMNVDGQLHGTLVQVRGALAQQLDHPVQWVRTIESLKAAGYNPFVECGHGRVLGGLLRRIDKSLGYHSTESVEAVEETINALQPEEANP